MDTAASMIINMPHGLCSPVGVATVLLAYAIYLLFFTTFLIPVIENVARFADRHATRWTDLMHKRWQRRTRRTYPNPVALTTDASRSGMLQRLPPEIRLEIYKHVLGHRLVHMLGDADSLHWRQCASNNNLDAWYHPCWRMDRPRTGLTALLLTNRHIYSEASEILYGSNTFHFLRPSCFLAFMRSIPPSGMMSFRSFKLYFNPTMKEEEAPYALMWKILSEMPRLQELRILIAPSIMTRNIWKGNEAALLEPIKGFKRRLAVFDVFLSVFPDWIEEEYVDECHIRSIREMEQLSGAHLSKYAFRYVAQGEVL